VRSTYALVQYYGVILIICKWWYQKEVCYTEYGENPYSRYKYGRYYQQSLVTALWLPFWGRSPSGTEQIAGQENIHREEHQQEPTAAAAGLSSWATVHPVFEVTGVTFPKRQMSLRSHPKSWYKDCVTLVLGHIRIRPHKSLLHITLHSKKCMQKCHRSLRSLWEHLLVHLWQPVCLPCTAHCYTSYTDICRDIFY